MRGSMVRWIALTLVAPSLILATACTSPAPAQAPPAQKPAPTAAPAQAAPTTQPAQAAPTTQAAPAASTSPSSAVPTLGPGPKITITMVGETNPAFVLHKEVVAPYTQQIIPQRSNGRIEIKLSTLAEMNLSGPEVMRLLRQGQVDMARPDAGYLAGELPFIEIADLSGLAPEAQMAQKVINAAIPPLNQELQRNGIMAISSAPNPGMVIFSKTQIKGLDSLKGLKLRTYNPSHTDLFGALGSQTVGNLAFVEVYEALNRGVVDAAITGSANGNSAKWFEVTRYLYNFPIGWGPGYYSANLAWWNKLPPDVQTFLVANLKEMEQKQWERAALLTQEGIDANTGRSAKSGLTLVKDNPMIEVKPGPEDLAQVKKIVAEKVIPGWIKRAGGDKTGEIYNNLVAPITGMKYVK